MSLKAKFVNVMKSCAYVQKLGENTFHRYKYATAADVFDKVNAALVEQGIMSVAKPTILSTEQVTTAKGGTETRVTVEMNVCLTDIATGESLTLTGYGCGQDAGDKAVMKAQTAALKYCYMMSLNISTGDDPEADSSVDARAANLTSQQKSEKTTAKPQATGEPENDKPVATAEAIVQGAEKQAPQSLDQRQDEQSVSQEQLKIIFVLSRRAGIPDEDMREKIHRDFQVTSSRELTRKQASALISELKAAVSALQAAG